MKKPAFTPGPWRLHKVAHLTVVGDQPGYGEMSVASCATASSNVHDLGEAQRANANLICAAPDLYAVLAEAVEDPEIMETGAWDRRVLAALAKAEGRS